MAGSIFNVKTFTAAVCLPLSAAIIGTSFRYIYFVNPEFGISDSQIYVEINITLNWFKLFTLFALL